jgi:L-alanine-DL-glutamate epimerase-like enolase superfamily enzyme
MAKAAQVSLASLIGSRIRESVPAYASLVRYGDSDLVARYSDRVLSEGFPEIKLHEITLPEIRRCRSAVGPDYPMIVDVNCNWSEEFCRETIPELISMKTRWLEEPIFPPEDFRLLADLRKTGIPIATGENACTSVQFDEILRVGAADFLQPSITKVGGISEFNKIRKLNSEHGIPFMPHSPYFGPGYLATLQMAAVEKDFELFEYLHVEPEAWLYRDMPLPENGKVQIPQGPGMGMDPDPDILEKYRTGS